MDGAFFNGEKFDRCRQIQKPEYEASGKISKQGYYVLGVDVGRHGCQSAVIVFKVTPQANGPAIKSIVNIYTYESEHFEYQAIEIKKLYYKYKARRIILDANGLGTGLLDFLVIKQVLPDGEILPKKIGLL